MTINFQSREEWFHFTDVNGNPISRKTEIRIDPLTKETARLVFDPGLQLTPPDYRKEAESTGGHKCPFCPENILKLTPLFPKEMVREGRIQYGNAILFPNLFPYSKYNGVVVFSGVHYVRLEDFTEKMIIDALTAAQTFINRIREIDPTAKYASINWNYLPASGGSILHPHMHIIVSDSPTNYQRQIILHSEDFKEDQGENYFASLSTIEKIKNERWIGETGTIQWCHAFAPKSHNDFLAIFQNRTSIEQIVEEDWAGFAKGLKGIFATLSEQGLASFNMALDLHENGDFIHARIIPRLTIGVLQTSDTNFFQLLHQEPLSYKYPEDIAKLAKKYFQSE